MKFSKDEIEKVCQSFGIKPLFKPTHLKLCKLDRSSYYEFDYETMETFESFDLMVLYFVTFVLDDSSLEEL